MMFNQYCRVRCAYLFSMYSGKLSLKKVRTAYPTRMLPEEKLGVTPAEALTETEHGKNNLPDVQTRWESINRYKEVVHEVVEHLLPKVILAKLTELEIEIKAGMTALEEMLF
jgi:hypothetical protein